MNKKEQSITISESTINNIINSNNNAINQLNESQYQDSKDIQILKYRIEGMNHLLDLLLMVMKEGK